MHLRDAVIANRRVREGTSTLWVLWQPDGGRGMNSIEGVDYAAFSGERVHRSADLLSLQNEVLEAVARGATLADTLDLLCRRVEAMAGDVRCSVLLLDGTRLRHGAAPSLPDAYTRAIDGAEIGPRTGSCGTAAFRASDVEVTDIAHDPLWEDYRDFALPHGLRACWSTPILGRDQSVLGTFALYFDTLRGPANFHRDAVKASTHLAAIAIERNRMDEAERQRVAQLAESHANIEALNRTLEQRVAQRTDDLRQRNADLARALEDLQRTQGELIEVRKQLSLGRLVAGVAHELNTPIGNARVLATSLQERCEVFRTALDTGSLSRAGIARFVADVADGSQLLAQALANAAERVGSFKSVVVDRAGTQRKEFLLADVARDVAVMFGPALRDARCTLTIDIAPGLGLFGYPAQLGQVLTNVIGNALVHGFADRLGGSITLRAAGTGDGYLELAVQDDGMGIPADVLPRVFDPFFTTRIGQGSSGLGLHVAHNIVHGLLGGSIQVRSEPGHGTTVLLRLPLVAPEAREDMPEAPQV